MRAGWASAFAVLCSSLGAALVAPRAAADVRVDRRLEVSGFVGYESFGDTELGNSWAPEQVPRTSALVGARLGWLVVPELVRSGGLRLSLGLEAELSLAAARTGDAWAGGERQRMSYFAPVFGWRGHALIRQPLGRSLALHAVLGGGGATVSSSSPFMAQETDPVAYAGLGATYAISSRLQLRADGRQGVMPGRERTTTRVSEVQLGVIATFGAAPRRAVPPRPPVDAPDSPDAIAAAAAAAAATNRDSDGDGVPDRLDRCPKENETVNGVADDDGCPEPDPDADGLVGVADACPLEAEDIDRFEDTDGCPDRDNDRDGIDDGRDVCPAQPETRNGYVDSDGCPDVLPEAIVRALASAAAVRFQAGRARVTPAIRRALQPVLTMLERDTDLAIAITGTPARAADADLAKRRAEAVKWHFVDLGIAEDRIDASVGPVGAGPPIVLKLRQGP